MGASAAIAHGTLVDDHGGVDAVAQGDAEFGIEGLAQREHLGIAGFGAEALVLGDAHDAAVFEGHGARCSGGMRPAGRCGSGCRGSRLL